MISLLAMVYLVIHIVQGKYQLCKNGATIQCNRNQCTQVRCDNKGQTECPLLFFKLKTLIDVCELQDAGRQQLNPYCAHKYPNTFGSNSVNHTELLPLISSNTATKRKQETIHMRNNNGQKKMKRDPMDGTYGGIDPSIATQQHGLTLSKQEGSTFW